MYLFIKNKCESVLVTMHLLQNDPLQHYWGTGQRMHMARDVRTHLRGSEKPHRRNNWDVKTYVREKLGH